MNPMAWMDCGQAIYEEDATKWATMFSDLSFHALSQGDADCHEAISHLSNHNFQKLLNTIATDRAKFSIQSIILPIFTIFGLLISVYF
jgi:hypothetical protein